MQAEADGSPRIAGKFNFVNVSLQTVYKAIFFRNLYSPTHDHSACMRSIQEYEELAWAS